MKRFEAEGYTNEDFLNAKKVCDGTSIDIAFFNECYMNLVAYISEKYSIRDDPAENPYDYVAEKEIHRKFKIMMYVDGTMTELSIGDFILKSLQDWDPNTATYLYYIHDLLVTWQARVPVKRTEVQQTHMYQLRSLIAVVKSVNPELDMKNLPFDEILQKLDQYLPEEYKVKLLDIIPIFHPELSLDVSLSEDEDSDTFLDMVESTYPSDDEIPALKKDPFLLIKTEYDSFKKAKLRKDTAPKISLYMTVELIQATMSYLSFDDFRSIAKQYPDFIVDVDWIEQVFQANTAEHPDYEISTRMPSQHQQAAHLMVDYFAYCMLIHRYKKKISNNQ